MWGIHQISRPVCILQELLIEFLGEENRDVIAFGQNYKASENSNEEN
jgi:hypothetical protein